ncbi:MAG: N-methyl-L-tryptophan oxidase [Acetobacteraceae bacterium]|nr:N-methyl-L-tryptophan oxidase [Acetobacteraceae bacterium]
MTDGDRDMIADVIVVGLGAVGAASLYQLAKSGARVVGVDRFAPPHRMGSSHGETRITRLAVGEGAVYAPLVQRSHAIWRDLEARSGTSLLQQSGALILGTLANEALHHGKRAFIESTIAVAEQHGIAHEVLTADAIARRFPQFRLCGDEVGYYEPEAGMVFPESCVATQIAAARELGASVCVNEEVRAVAQHGDVVTVRTDRETWRARRCVVAAGPWVGTLLGGEIGRITRVYRQALHWFAPAVPSDFSVEKFPVFIWLHGSQQDDYCYGFPLLPGATGVKVATENYLDATDPDRVNRDVACAESEAMYRTHVAGRIAGLSAQVVRSEVCLYTVTPDGDFVIDWAPAMDRVLIVSPCSGHGFKHSAALGEAIAQLCLDGGSAISLAPFALGRVQLSA